MIAKLEKMACNDKESGKKCGSYRLSFLHTMFAVLCRGTWIRTRDLLLPKQAR